jgi:hypothetical protein
MDGLLNKAKGMMENSGSSNNQQQQGGAAPQQGNNAQAGNAGSEDYGDKGTFK